MPSEPLPWLARQFVELRLMSAAALGAAAASADRNATTLIAEVYRRCGNGEEAIAMALSQALSLPLLDADAIDLTALPPDCRSLAEREPTPILPLWRRGQELSIAVADPTDKDRLERLRFRADVPRWGLRLVLCLPSRLDAVIDELQHSPMPVPPLGEALVADGLLGASRLDRHLFRAHRQGTSVLIELHATLAARTRASLDFMVRTGKPPPEPEAWLAMSLQAEEARLAAWTARYFGLPVVNPLERLRAAEAAAHADCVSDGPRPSLPLFQDRGGVTVGVVDPAPDALPGPLRALGPRLRLAVCEPTRLRAAIDGFRQVDLAQAQQAGSSRIFISYRREDAAGHTGRLHDMLAERFGHERIFLDIDNVAPGDDFVEVIDRTLAECSIVLVVIGIQWLTAARDGVRRLDHEADFHRLEIERALALGKRVIPVLVGGAAMPRSADLPAPLQPMTRRNAFELSDKRFRLDAAKLVEIIADLAGA